jgi:spore germination protein YaaH
MDSEFNEKRARRRLFISTLLVLLLIAATCDYFFYPYGKPLSAPTANTGANGLWLSPDWYTGNNTHFGDLASRLTCGQFRYAYFHVEYIDSRGNLIALCPQTASTLVSKVHELAPGTSAIAWINVGNRAGHGQVDLGNPAVRAQMVHEAVWLTAVCGFDGVQWDYEVCRNNNPYLIDLLRETRAALPPGKLLSVAAPLIVPHLPGAWSDSYYERVASKCDQIDVMCYDTYATFPRTYVWLTSAETARILDDTAHANPSCKVLIGIPTYSSRTLKHNPRAENITLALRGVRAGVQKSGIAGASFAGVAVFVDYTTTQQDWNQYHRLWLNH